MADDIDIGFKVYAVIDGLKESMSQASASVAAFSSQATQNINELSKGFKALGELTEAYMALLAVERVEQFFDGLAQSATAVERLSLEFGIGAEQVQGLQFAMTAAGGSGDQLQSLLSRLSVAMEKAIDSAGPQREAFDSLGISLKFIQDNANNAPAVLDALADSVQRLGAGSQVTADLIPLMGRGAASIVPALANGSQGLKDMQQAARDTGGVMDSLEQGQFERMHVSLATLGEAFHGLAITVGSALAPAFTAIVNGLTEAISSLAGGETHVSAFRVALAALVLPIDAVVLGIDAIKTVIVEMYEEVADKFTRIVEYVRALGVAINDFKNGDIEGMQAHWDDAMVTMEANTRQRADDMKKELTDLGATASAMASGLAGLVTGGSPEAPKDNGDPKKNKTKEETEDAKKALEEQIQMAQLEYSTEDELGKISLQNKKDLLAAGVAEGKISKEQEVAQLKDLSEQEYAIDKKALDDEAEIDGLSVVQKQKIYDQLLILKAKHEADMNKLTLQGVQAQNAEYQQLFTTFNNGFKTMIQGVLQGTQTWQQAFSRMFTDILASFAGFLEEKAAKWVENQLFEMAFGKATAATEAEGAIAASAAQAGAAAYASTAAIPIIGPMLAPAAAALAYGSTLAFSGAVAASAAGGYDVPAGVNPVTQIHSEEMVLPANLANAVRDMASRGGAAGGDTHNWYISTLDGQTTKRFFIDNGAHIAASLSMQARNANPHVTKIGQ